MQHPKYLSFAGGGTYGFLYIGFYRALSTHLPIATGMTVAEFFNGIDGFAGVSIGALAALAFSLNLSMEKYEALFERNMNLSDLMPQHDFAQMLQVYGLDRGDALKRMISDVLKSAGISDSATFEDLKRLLKRDFACVATNLNTSAPQVFSARETPEVCICDAVYMSMAVPFLFVPLKYKGDTMSDGGLTQHMPNVFNEDETLFVDLSFYDARLPTTTIQDFCVACLSARESNRWYLKKQCLVLQTPSDICTHPCDFEIQEHLALRVQCGYNSTVAFLYPRVVDALHTTLRLMFALCLGERRREGAVDAAGTY
jgi:predicted acylesterase/phospholipase RssA